MAAMDVYSAVKTVIAGKGYDLADLSNKIDVLYALGRITDSQRAELSDSAVNNADINNSLGDIYERVATLEKKVAALEELANSEAELIDSDETDEWPAFVQPTSAADAYAKGAQVTYNEQHYVSLIDANVWSPEAYPAGWQLSE